MILKTEFYTIMDRAIAIKRDKYQRWPVHVVAQAGKVFHKSGELMKAASEYKYEKAEGLEQSKEQHDAMETLCLETIATCLRFLEKRRPFSHPDLPAAEPEVETQQEIFSDPRPLVTDEVGQFTTEDVRAIDYERILGHRTAVEKGASIYDEAGVFQTTTEEIVVDGENKLLVTHRGPEIRLPISPIETTLFPDVLDEITPEQLEQAALLLDEPDHTFTEKNPE